MNGLIKEMFKEVSFTEKEEILISKKITQINLHKGEYLLKENEETSDFNFIYKGCLRTYYKDPLGKEHTLQFGIKGWWISDYIALFEKGNPK